MRGSEGTYRGSARGEDGRYSVCSRETEQEGEQEGEQEDEQEEQQESIKRKRRLRRPGRPDRRRSARRGRSVSKKKTTKPAVVSARLAREALLENLS